MRPLGYAPTGELLDDSIGGVMRGLAALAMAVVLTIFLVAAVPVLMLAALLAPLSGTVREQPTLATPSAALPVGPPSSVVDVARRYLGVPYVFGGTNPAVGLDCSGLVQLVYRQAGAALPRTAQQQFDATARVTPDQLQPGDLVFFFRTYADPRDWITHVGIYIGGGMQINAPTEGQVVSVQPVFSGFWGSHFASGGRVRTANQDATEETR
jgi:cell wall-associated NlpC family hydrolase